jgi:hypothetical protein
MKRVLFLSLVTAGIAVSQSPQLSNARMETRALQGDAYRYLENLAASENGPMWFGYAVASNRKDNNSCCWDNDCRGCNLEDKRGTVNAGTGPAKVELEGSAQVLILYRVENRVIGKIRPVSASCPLDAGGLRFLWLTGVDTKASIRFLTSLADAHSEKHGADEIFVSISMHAGDEADQALERFTRPSEPEWKQEKALFWLASARGARGFGVVRDVARTSPSDRIREKAMFDLSISHEPGAIEEMIHSAKSDSSARVRSQAIFWLSQKAGKKAAAMIQDAVNNDPDTEVKKKAVFALQQLPKDEGIPLLIQVAKTNKNPEVRKQAFFWLGQSGDPRALAFIEETLVR